MAAKKITERDDVVWRILKDPNYRVTEDGVVETRYRPRNGIGPWRRAGRVSFSRRNTKFYRRLKYKGVEVYEHRVVFAWKNRKLDSTKPVDHKNHIGTQNHPSNLQQITVEMNMKRAVTFYRHRGLTAAEYQSKWAPAT